MRVLMLFLLCVAATRAVEHHIEILNAEDIVFRENYTLTAFSYRCQTTDGRFFHVATDSYDRDAPWNVENFKIRSGTATIVFARHGGYRHPDEDPGDLESPLNCRIFTWVLQDAKGEKVQEVAFVAYPPIPLIANAVVLSRGLSAHDIGLDADVYDDAINAVTFSDDYTDEQRKIVRTGLQCGSFSRAELNNNTFDRYVDSTDDFALYVCAKLLVDEQQNNFKFFIIYALTIAVGVALVDIAMKAVSYLWVKMKRE